MVAKHCGGEHQGLAECDPEVHGVAVLLKLVDSMGLEWRPVKISAAAVCTRVHSSHATGGSTVPLRRTWRKADATVLRCMESTGLEGCNVE